VAPKSEDGAAHDPPLPVSDVRLVEPDFINFYNDAYIPMLGNRHP
jgi:hypothetical protein